MISIRTATKDDLRNLGIIYKEAYNVISIGENWTDETAYKLLKHFYAKQPDLFFVAEVDGKIVGGIVSLLKPWWDGNHLTDGEIFVSPAFQGKGIGIQLIKHMFTEGLQKYQAISWDTFTHRVYEYPLKWYKQIGFQEINKWVMITGDIKEVLKRLK